MAGVQILEPRYFRGIDPVKYEGVRSDNPLAFKWYKPDRRVLGQRMGDLLNFAVAMWHAMEQQSADPFGAGTQQRPWKAASDPMHKAEDTLYALFEFVQLLGINNYCFHDYDMAPEGNSLKQSDKRLWELAEKAKEYQDITGINCLWATQNLFSNPRYANGAFTNPDAEIVAYAMAQTKTAIEVGAHLKAAGHTFWGGREGYQTILNTNMRRELGHLAMALEKAAEYSLEVNPGSERYVEPKPMEPTKHQYDFDSATVLNFLKEHGLLDRFSLNIEDNHATLAGHDPYHELRVASDAGKLGSVDANRGDKLLGWDTDQYSNNVNTTALAMLVILEQGGLGKGGLNFDAKVRRESTDLRDLVAGHVGGIDVWAQGALVADYLIDKYGGAMLLPLRYASFDTGLGAEMENGQHSLEEMHTIVTAQGLRPEHISGQQELLEIAVNDAIRMVNVAEADRTR